MNDVNAAAGQALSSTVIDAHLGFFPHLIDWILENYRNGFCARALATHAEISESVVQAIIRRHKIRKR